MLGERSITYDTDRTSNLATAVSFSEYCLLLYTFGVHITGSFVSVITACSTVILENFVVP